MQSQEITSENKEEDQKRQHFSDSAFGSNPQPVLERVEFKVCRRCSDHDLIVCSCAQYTGFQTYMYLELTLCSRVMVKYVVSCGGHIGAYN